MDRTELAITVLGLVATFCMPWPSGQGPSEGASAMWWQAGHDSVSVPEATTGTLAAVQPER